MSKIGIGITSFHRPEHLELCVKQIAKHTKEYTQHIAKDIPNIAKAKNECLYALKDCDHIFLFDDDCFPVDDRWVDFFIDTRFGHLLYLTDRHNKNNYHSNISKENYYQDCGGCFMYMSKEIFNKVGYFNSEYKQYGFEHAGYSKRCFPYYLSKKETDKYLYSLDYQGEGNWGVKHKPSITDYKAMQESIDYNRKVFEKEINSDKIYYEYTHENSI